MMKKVKEKKIRSFELEEQKEEGMKEKSNTKTRIM
jgi:hypothetical protein